MSRPRAAIHDLGYQRYLGARRPQSSRWRSIVVNQLATAWRGFWRMKAWVIASAMTTAVFAILMYVGRQEVFEALSTRMTGSPLTMIDALLPFAFEFYTWFGFVLSVSVAAAVVPRDLAVGAFEFYFSRPVRPIDYVIGKLVGLTLVMAAVMVAGPVVLALYRVGIADAGQVIATLPVVGKALLIGALSAATYAVLPLACGALVGKPRNAIAIWAALYLIAGPVIDSLAGGLGRPALAALSPKVAVESLAYGLFDVSPVASTILDRGGVTAPGWAGGAALVGYVVLGTALTWWRVVRAEQAGLGGG